MTVEILRVNTKKKVKLEYVTFKLLLRGRRIMKISLIQEKAGKEKKK